MLDAEQKRPDATVSVGLMQPFLRRISVETMTALSSRGEAILGDIGKTIPEMHPEMRIPHRVAMGLLDLACEGTGDPALGIHAARDSEDADFGVMGYIGFVSHTMRESIETTIRYITLLHEGVHMELAVDGDTAMIKQGYTAEPVVPASNDFIMTALIARARRHTGMNLRPEEVRFMHTEPDYVQDYRDFFQCPVTFGAEYNALVMPSAALEFVFPQGRSGAYPSMLQRADLMLSELSRSKPFITRVRDVIVKELAFGGPGLKNVANKLHTSERTVRRRLQEEGTTHRALVEEVRMELAKRHLMDPSVTLSEIAFLLGFSQETTFHRAFRRWFKMPPSEYRRSIRNQ